MKVKRLHLQNYGRFEDLKIDFAPTAEKTGNVTVIVGNNGAGKSQILQALATSFSWFVEHLRNGKGRGFLIEEQLIKNNRNDASIEITTDFGDHNYISLFNNDGYTRWQISSVREGRNSTFEEKIFELESVVEEYRNHLTKKDRYSLPLLVFYPVERSSYDNKHRSMLSKHAEQFKGYFECLDGARIDFYDFKAWFREREDIENEAFRQKVNSNKYQNKIEDIVAEIKQLSHNESEVELFLSQSEPVDENVKRMLLKEQKRIKLSILNLSNLYNSLDENQNFFIQDDVLSITKAALEKFTGFTNIHIRRRGTPTMIVEKDGEELDVNQLSQGEKSLLALVGDIARRLALLNPSLDNPLEGEGVVMIDEVDLHLHPKWQHDLIDKLVATFPNVQFILTTHSPHVISDRNDILLYSLDDGELTEMPNVYGEDANTVLTKIFDVDIRDSDVEEQFTIIRRAISKHDFVTAENVIAELAEKLPSDHLELLKCRLLLAQSKLANSNIVEPSHAKD